jgi:hypothetical protein
VRVRACGVGGVTALVFLGKLGLFAYLVKRFLPSLCPLPANFLTSRPTAGSLLRFWPLYVYCAAYYYAQKLLGYDTHTHDTHVASPALAHVAVQAERLSGRDAQVVPRRC